MKKRLKQIIQLIIIMSISAGLSYHVSGQEKWNISVGIGFPELTNIGVKYQYKPMQFGVNIGLLPLSDEMLFTLSGDIYYHFGGSSAFSERPPWYLRAGLIYLHDETDEFIDKYLHVTARIGRDFNFSEKIGLAIGAGAAFELYNELVEKTSYSDYWNIEFPVIPCLSFTLFYRIGV